MSAPHGGGSAWRQFPGFRLCAHGTGLVQSAETQRVTVYLQRVCVCVFLGEDGHTWPVLTDWMFVWRP